ncbi:hypothetical protein FHW68_003583 [Pseudomonas sp. Tn43]|uniref:hypothetical protein n=1 Tax=Pseudomonas sp. Tn43 TaxID=701213 RepID=UPI0016172066|nr:hypothetical protein [Pseudomonas sp. Tn43]MBB3242046.1 hypothetical protein [Pseudomonas sp. Tn43]
MSILHQPVPMLAPTGWGASINTGLPTNAHLRAKLESLDNSCNALECYDAASMFLLHKVVSFDGASERHLRKYSVSLERALNWSFIVARKSVFDWDQVDIQRYLDFVEIPDSSWVCSSSFSRFVSNKNEPYEKWAINEHWRPFKRKFSDGAVMPPYWGELDKERTLILDFFLYLSQKASYPLTYLDANIVEKLRREIPTKRPPRSLRREHRKLLFKMSSFELDWVFEKATEFSKGKWQYELVLFAMAIARYSNLPIKPLCRASNSTGLLSQFYRQSGEWYFVTDSGAPTERIYKLDAQIDPYIQRYLRYLGLAWDQPLSDTHIFRRPEKEQGFGYDYLAEMMESLRHELYQLVENHSSDDLNISQEIPQKFSLWVIRRSRPMPKREPKRRGSPHKTQLPRASLD